MGRNRQLIIRVTDDEKQRIRERAGKMRVATFMRTAALDSIPPRIPEINRAALYELHKIGSNLNQLAHHANSSGSLQVTDMINELQSLRSALRLHLIEPVK